MVYNIFMNMNMSSVESEDRISQLFRLIGQPTRVQILLELGRGEACVCHLEAHLGLRQAAISQHLMALRDAGLLVTRRHGRFIYYRLADPGLLDLIRLAARSVGIPEEALERPARDESACECPRCVDASPCQGEAVADDPAKLLHP